MADKYRVLSLEDSPQVQDSIDNQSLAEARMNDTGLGGVVEFVNPETNESLLVKNLVVQRGRTFALEKLYGVTCPDDTNYIQNLNRRIMLFSVGEGGAPQSSPFEPTPPSPTDQELVSKVPFRAVDPSDPSTNIDSAESSYYPFYEEVGGLHHYNYKMFDESNSKFIVNKADNKIYRQVPILLTENDCVQKRINELALYFCTSEFKDIEMYSRLTFETEPMSNIVEKGLLIYYYTYA